MENRDQHARRRWWGWGPTLQTDNIIATNDNNNEINSNYMDSMETNQNTDSYSFDEMTGSFSLDDDDQSFDQLRREEVNENIEENNVFVENDNLGDAPDSFTEAAQNDYNDHVERIIQESLNDVSVEEEREEVIENDSVDGAESNASIDLSNRPIINNRVEVDILGIEASTTLLLLGIGVIVISRWYAVFYFTIVALLLFGLRRRANRENARANAQLNYLHQLHVTRIFRDLSNAFKAIGMLFGAVLLIPFGIIGCFVWLNKFRSRDNSTNQARSRPQAGNDLKFVFQLMFFPLFIPFWLNKLGRHQHQVRPAANPGHGPNPTLLRALVRFLQRGHRH